MLKVCLLIRCVDAVENALKKVDILVR